MADALPVTTQEGASLPDKRQVAASFSRAAASYDSVASLQRDVGEALLARMPEQAVERWVDLGCGTGYFTRALAARYPNAQGIAVDLAEGMLRHARPLGGAEHFVAGDAERLPLKDQACDLLFTSLAIQWCGDLSAVLSEAQRILRPGGLFAFTSLCTGTLQELRDSWQAVDGFVHVNRFRQFEDYQRACAASEFKQRVLDVETRVLHFPNVRSLTHELKALGAHNVNPGRATGLTGRARLNALAQAYERFRQPQGLPACYRVVYGIFQKES